MFSYDILLGNLKKEKRERDKGKSLLEFPDGYTVIDIETTGLSPEFDYIIELSALKVKNGNVGENFSSLVKPTDYEGNFEPIPEFITELTGITNKMLRSAPLLENVLPNFLDFVGRDIVVGHNVNFDINFIYDDAERLLNTKFQNDFCDLLRISRKLFPEFKNHKLKTIADELKVIPQGEHRALADCITTAQCFEYHKKYALEKGINLSSTIRHKLDLSKISTTTDDIDAYNPFYGMHCVFTGTLELMKRADAAQIVVNLGGICENNVTKNTNFLILGNNDYCSSIKDGKSSKQKKAEKLILEGQDLKIIPENVFYDMIQIT